MGWNEAVLMVTAIVWVYVEVDAHTKNSCVKIDAVLADKIFDGIEKSLKYLDDVDTVMNGNNEEDKKKIQADLNKMLKTLNFATEAEFRIFFEAGLAEFIMNHLFLDSLAKKTEERGSSTILKIVQDLPCDICATSKWELGGGNVYQTSRCMTMQEFCDVREKQIIKMLMKRKTFTEERVYDPTPSSTQCEASNAKIKQCKDRQDAKGTKDDVKAALSYSIKKVRAVVPSDILDEITPLFAIMFRLSTVLFAGFESKTVKVETMVNWGYTVVKTAGISGQLKWKEFVNIFNVLYQIQDALPCDACGKMEIRYEVDTTEKTLMTTKCMSWIDFCLFRLISEVTLASITSGGSNVTLGVSGGYSISDVSATPNTTICALFEKNIGRVKRAEDKKTEAKAAQKKKRDMKAANKQDTDATKLRLKKEAEKAGVAGMGTAGIIVLLHKLY